MIILKISCITISTGGKALWSATHLKQRGQSSPSDILLNYQELNAVCKKFTDITQKDQECWLQQHWITSSWAPPPPWRRPAHGPVLRTRTSISISTAQLYRVTVSFMWIRVESMLTLTRISTDRLQTEPNSPAYCLASLATSSLLKTYCFVAIQCRRSKTTRTVAAAKKSSLNPVLSADISETKLHGQNSRGKVDYRPGEWLQTCH